MTSALLLLAVLSSDPARAEQCAVAATVSAATCAKVAIESGADYSDFGVCQDAGHLGLVFCAKTVPPRDDCSKLGAWYQAVIDSACDGGEQCADWGAVSRAFLTELCLEAKYEDVL